MKDLVKLASYFPQKLYMVGGAVRDMLAGVNPHDIDIAADVSSDEVKRILDDSDFFVYETSKKLMTLKIVGEKAYEYTAFRTDSYTEGHSPDEVKRTSDINEDAMRRDFTVNAVYYDINGGDYVDPLGGRADIEKKLMRMTRRETFEEDGLRLMRLCRQAAELGFDIEENTLLAAKANSFRIREISPERIREELERILVADLRYGVADAHYRGLRLLDEIGVLEQILPELTLGKGMSQPKAYHRYDVFDHILETVRLASPEVRTAALFHDIGKPYCQIEYGKYSRHGEEGERITAEIMKKYRYSNAEIKEVCFLVKNHMFDLKNDKTEHEVKLFLQKNIGYAEKLFALKEADYKGSGVLQGECATVKRHRAVLAEMRKNNVPFGLSELLLDGYDLEALGAKGAQIGRLLNDLLESCVDGELGDKGKQTEYIKARLHQDNP